MRNYFLSWLTMGTFLFVGCPHMKVDGFVSPKAFASKGRQAPLQRDKIHSPINGRHSISLLQESSHFSDSESGLLSSKPMTKKNQLHKDVVIIGGGLAGLSAALYLSQMDPDRRITIVDREDRSSHLKKKTAIASFAAAGMLAPQSERLPKGRLLELCLASRSMYSDFCSLVESLAEQSGEEGRPYALASQSERQQSDSKTVDWSVGYLASGGFLAPAFAGDSVATWAPPDDSGSAMWLDEIQVRELEPNLHPQVVGGWWFSEDASVDARRLTCSLHAACVAAGVELLCGKQYEVTSLDLTDGTCHGLWVANGRRYFKAKAVLVANGAWMRNLLPVPIEPHKGQSLSLKMPQDRPPLLRRVLFSQDSYIVPKADGHIIVGATVEAGSFDSNVTPTGIMHILHHALQLVPALAELPIVETWAGLRPTTPDKSPILGESPWKNLFLAGGYWRNGVLLAPKTGQLLASLIASKSASNEKDVLTQHDKQLLEAFAWDRFISKEGGAAIAATARYQASMFPIHSRKSGAGVAAAVGTELGSYSTASTAKAERQKDRMAMFGYSSASSTGSSASSSIVGSENLDEDSFAAFERAAELGRKDATSFTFDEDIKGNSPNPIQETSPSASKTEEVNEQTYDGYVDIQEANSRSSREKELEAMRNIRKRNRLSEASTGSMSDELSKMETVEDDVWTNDDDDNDEASNLTLSYQKIIENKAKGSVSLPETTESDDGKADIGFRIYHIDSETGEHREVPPYTKPEAFLSKIAEEKAQTRRSSDEAHSATTMAINGDILNGKEVEKNGFQKQETNEEATYDGYTDIIEDARSQDDKEYLESMRAARQANRLGQSSIDDDKLGNRVEKVIEGPQEAIPEVDIASTGTTESLYKKIQDNKSKQNLNLPEITNEDDDRQDPGFRIYHIDSVTGESKEVPPYTRPEEFLKKEGSKSSSVNDSS